MQAGRALDVNYAASLSADAVPALVEALPAMNQNERSFIAAQLFYKRAALNGTDWRSWNWSRREAASLLEDEFGLLWQSACLNSGNQSVEAIWQCRLALERAAVEDDYD
jgi:hypothetical protein